MTPRDGFSRRGPRRMSAHCSQEFVAREGPLGTKVAREAEQAGFMHLGAAPKSRRPVGARTSSGIGAASRTTVERMRPVRADPEARPINPPVGGTLMAFPPGIIGTGVTPRGRCEVCENPHRPTPLLGRQQGGSLPSSAESSGAASQLRRPCRNCKTASHIRERWRAHRNGVSVHMHPDV